MTEEAKKDLTQALVEEKLDFPDFYREFLQLRGGFRTAFVDARDRGNEEPRENGTEGVDVSLDLGSDSEHPRFRGIRDDPQNRWGNREDETGTDRNQEGEDGEGEDGL